MNKNLVIVGLALFFATACTKTADVAKVSLPEKETVEQNSNALATESKEANLPTSNSPAANLAVPKDDQLFMRISGTVIPAKQSQLSFKVGGHVAKVFVRLGDKVKAGQVLAELDSTDFVLRSRLALAATQQAKIGAEQAKKDLTREEQLKKENVTSQSNIERAINAQTSAQIAYEIAQINLETSQKMLNDTKLLAPFDGIISKKIKSEGEFVAAGNQVFEAFEHGNLEISLKVPETFLKRIAIGKSLNIRVPASNLKTQAKIARIVPMVQESSRTFEVICNSITDANQLVPGQFVEAEIN